jgi:hypothetical protein
MAGGAAVVAAQGKNPGGTAGVGRGATGGSKPGGISGAGRRGAGVEVPTVVRWVPMVEIGSQTHKENLGQLDWVRQRVGSCPYQKPHVVRRSDGLSRDQGSDSLCDRQSSPRRHTEWNVGRAYVVQWQSC